MNEKIQAIFDSFINGQITQMIEQINEYGGISQFYVDYMNQIGFFNGDAQFGGIVYKYHLHILNNE